MNSHMYRWATVTSRAWPAWRGGFQRVCQDPGVWGGTVHAGGSDEASLDVEWMQFDPWVLISQPTSGFPLCCTLFSLRSFDDAYAVQQRREEPIGLTGKCGRTLSGVVEHGSQPYLWSSAFSGLISSRQSTRGRNQFLEVNWVVGYRIRPSTLARTGLMLITSF